MKISAVVGTAFVDFSKAGILTNKLGHLLEIKDSAGKKLRGYIKAAGTGETLDSELQTSWGNGSYWGSAFDTLTSSGAEITQAENASGTKSAYSTIAVVAGMLTKTVYGLTLTSGTLPKIYFTDGVASTMRMVNMTAGAGTEYCTFVAGGAGARVSLFSSAAVVIDGITWSTKKVLTPSDTGVTIVSAKGGTTYNWTSQETGFNYNDSSGYTYRILKIAAAPVVATITEVSGKFHVATVATGAMMFSEDNDYSIYAGTGQFRLTGYDATEKMCFDAFGGVVGGGAAEGAEIATGTLTAAKLYHVTATEVDHFGSGLIVGSYFTSAGTETCDANNKVKEVTNVAATGLLLCNAAGTQSVIQTGTGNLNGVVKVVVRYTGSEIDIPILDDAGEPILDDNSGTVLQQG
jgi:hypothetical protein